MRTSSSTPAKYSPQIVLPPMLSWSLDVAIGPLAALGRDLSAVDEHAQCRAVVGRSDVRPRVVRELRCAAQVKGRGGRVECDVRAVRVGVPVHAVVEGVRPSAARNRRRPGLLHHQCPPVRDSARLHPRLQRHPGRQVERRSVGDADERVRAIERDAVAELAGDARRIDQRPRVPEARRVTRRGSGRLAEPVSGDEPRRRGRRRRGSGVFVRVGVAVGVLVRVGVAVGVFVRVGVAVGGTGVFVRVAVAVGGRPCSSASAWPSAGQAYWSAFGRRHRRVRRGRRHGRLVGVAPACRRGRHRLCRWPASTGVSVGVAVGAGGVRRGRSGDRRVR